MAIQSHAMRRAARIDNTSKALIAYAESLGFVYLSINGTVDGVLAWGQAATVVDWKSKGGALTPAQSKLVARGFPVRFIGQPEQLDALRAELMKDR